MSRELPSVVLWEITYACPLRCPFCYSESGVRPSRQLGLPEMLRIADALAAMKPRVVHLSGGEPLLVKGLFEVAERLARAEVSVVLTTSGFGLDEARARRLAPVLHSTHISVDGADATTHDRLRGKPGSFDAALGALSRLDELSRERRAIEGKPVRFGIDCVVVRSNFDELARIVNEFSARFSELEFVIMNGVVPQGLASRESYESELLSDDQTELLEREDFVASLNARISGAARVFSRNNLDLRMHPSLVDEGAAWTLDRLIVEPDGMVRALEIYEGHVGNVLTDAPEQLWARVLERRNHPYIVDQLSRVRSSRDWARATRKIDRFFASPDDLVRIQKRKPFSA